jgi:hypothetical protein
VNQTLAGNADRIKGYTVATEAFGRRSDFDQSIDPIVSIQASRLRRAMERYYKTAGKHDPIRIDIPPEADIDFMIDGNVRRNPAGVKVTIRLCDVKTGLQICSWFQVSGSRTSEPMLPER